VALTPDTKGMKMALPQRKRPAHPLGKAKRATKKAAAKVEEKATEATDKTKAKVEDKPAETKADKPASKSETKGGKKS
jgi:hypothetical protein